MRCIPHVTIANTLSPHAIRNPAHPQGHRIWCCRCPHRQVRPSVFRQ
jgi:hypothetical protein